MIEQPSYGRTFLVTFQVSLLTTAICILARLPAGLCDVADVGARNPVVPDPGAAAVLDLAAGAHLRLAGAAAAQGPGQRVGHPPGLVGRAAGPGAQPDRHADRHGPHHAALPGAAAARRDARDRCRLPEGRRQPRRQPGTGVLERVLSAVDAGPAGRHADRLHPVPGLLRHAGGAGRRQGDHGLEPHRQRHRTVLQLGRGQRAGRRAAGADAGLPVRGACGCCGWTRCSGGVHADELVQRARIADADHARRRACGCTSWPRWCWPS